MHKVKELLEKETLDPPYRSVLEAIEDLLNKEEPSIVAIDGMCGSGKSTLAAMIKDHYDCNVFHMDDYFLPFEMKTEERLAQPGGNVHYERFKDEILDSILAQKSVVYRPYQCAYQRLGDPIKVNRKKLSIVEGSYALHPSLMHSYKLTIFLKHNQDVQLERIRNRSGEDKLQQFIHKWIPMENYYFNNLKIETVSDIVLDTTYLW